MNAKLAAIVALLIVVVAAAAGYGGYSLGKGAGVAEASTARSNFFQARGGGTGTGGGFAGGNGRNFNPDNFAAGQVKSLDGNTIELSTATSVVKVTVSDQTQIQKQAQGSLADIRPGERLVIQGSHNADGSLTAQSIQVGRLPGGVNGQSDAAARSSQ